MALRKKSAATRPAGKAGASSRTAAPSKAGAAGKAGKPPKAKRGERLKQVKQAYVLTKERDPRLLGYVVLALMVPLVLGVLVAVLTGSYLLWPLAGFAVGVLAAAQVFGRRAQKAAYSQVEGQPGVAAGVVQSMRGDWRVSPAVQFNRNQDMVHRVVGRCGVVLLAEGTGRGPRELLAQEARRVKRVSGDAVIYDVFVGNDEGQVPLQKLGSHLMKLPRLLKPAQVEALDRRLKALGGASLPIPKGPMPRSVPRGGKLR